MIFSPLTLDVLFPNKVPSCRTNSYSLKNSAPAHYKSENDSTAQELGYESAHLSLTHDEHTVYTPFSAQNT